MKEEEEKLHRPDGARFKGEHLISFLLSQPKHWFGCKKKEHAAAAAAVFVYKFFPFTNLSAILYIETVLWKLS